MGTPQLSLDFPAILPKGVYDYGERSSGETHGLVLTRPHVVELILGLAGYSPERDLSRVPLLEPSCGHGAFVVEAVRRLMASARTFGRGPRDIEDAITAVDVEPSHVAITRRAVVEVLRGSGIKASDAERLANRWVVQADFLLSAHQRRFSAIVGNPPYVRIEQLSPVLQSEYRSRYESLYDRADLYVAFIERSLQLLAPDGVLSFICADRWILNRYGAPLRRLLTERFGVRCYLDLHRASPFESDVIAYPSIFAIGAGPTRSVHVGALQTGSPEECAAALRSVQGEKARAPGLSMSVYDGWFSGDEPWVISTPAHLATLRSLEARFQPIESYGTRVGIGVATGNDKIYIVGEGADIEPTRLVPLLMREDIHNGKVTNARRFVLNTFEDDGRVVDLAKYPRLARYLESHGPDIRRRHVARKNPGSWFRTIDRVYPDLVAAPKLLIPDIAGSNEIAFDEGHYHPHHNLYFVVSETWDMEVLGGLLGSKIALFFVWSYAVKMRGGYLRFQAQYLRRIRVPDPRSLPPALAGSLRLAFRERDFAALDRLACEAYGLDSLPAFDFVDTRR